MKPIRVLFLTGSLKLGGTAVRIKNRTTVR